LVNYQSPHIDLGRAAAVRLAKVQPARLRQVAPGWKYLRASISYWPQTGQTHGFFGSSEPR